MLYESEILVDLSFRVPGHACELYTGIYRGLPRNQRRQAVRDRETWWKQEVRAWRLLRQISRMIYFIDTLLYSVEEVKDWYGGRLFVTPLSHICIARREANHDFLVSRGFLPLWYIRNIKATGGRCEVLPWPPKSQRKKSRWQLPPNGKKFRQRGGLAMKSISAVDLFPPEWRVKDAYKEEEGDDEVA